MGSLEPFKIYWLKGLILEIWLFIQLNFQKILKNFNCYKKACLRMEYSV